ncbi:GtrA family protein [Corynebacterium mucifaciens]|uniref:GtrA family protein n=1 Tax=Corynebacterium mucifaciens TaxID=57171 RepID=A0A7X6LSU7_9CORY|nr:GtrA family protein [Corynebacterium mucifaciens]NKY69698.1 GtrA family protein [Corynebacterium mucifaciens]
MKRQLVPFLLIGVGCAVIDFGITYTLNEPLGWQRDFAKAVGWVFGTAAAYVLNSKFSFNAKINAKKASAVFVLYAVTFAVQLVLWRVTDVPLASLGLVNPWKDAVSFVIAQGVATVTNFELQRHLIFKEAKVAENPLAPPA